MKRPEYLDLPFDEAIKYFRNKIPIPTENWRQFEAEQHDFAFTIAGLTKASLLDDARYLVDRGIAEGASFDEFKKDFRKLIERRGWTPTPLPAGPKDYRLRIIYETNIRRAYSAGRYKQLNDPDILKSRPYRMWSHGDSRNPRETHIALDGKVFDATDKFWEVAHPSCAYGCKCRAYSLSEKDLKRMGKKVEAPPDPYTVAEKGFQRAAGTTPVQERKEILKRGVQNLSPDLNKLIQKDLKSKGII